jgi:succinate dehydrogenase hydrophobic anchor subunit
MNQTETPVVRTTTQAREGVTGHGVRYVLMISTTAVVVAFVAIWLFYFT